jgi:hypothetical protein
VAKYRRICVALCLSWGIALSPALAQDDQARPPADDPAWGLCAGAAAKVETELGLPPFILTAVSLAETGWAGPDHRVSTWPWTVHDGDRGYHLASKQEAVRFVRDLRTEGRRSIDVGCMQVNLHHHPRAFTSVTEGFDALANVRYAGSFLKELASESSSWEEAIAKYHTQNPTVDEDYAPRVLAFWARERARPEMLTPSGTTAQIIHVGGVGGHADSLLRSASAQPTAAQLVIASSATPGTASAQSTPAPLVLRRSFGSAR